MYYYFPSLSANPPGQSSSTNDQWSNLFKEGIITQNPVVVISAGSLESIYEEEFDDDEDIDSESGESLIDGDFGDGGGVNHLHPYTTYDSISRKKKTKSKKNKKHVRIIYFISFY